MADQFYRSGNRQGFSDSFEARSAMCNGKAPLTWAQAKKVRDRSSRKRPSIAYHCPVCKTWHIGSPMKKKRRRWKEWN